VQQVDVAAAQGETVIVLSTGSRSDAAAQRLRPDLASVCFVEVGDYTGVALRRAARSVTWSSWVSPARLTARSTNWAALLTKPPARATRLPASGTGTVQRHDTARALVAQLEAAITADDAAVEAAQIQLGYTRIRSPIGGRAGVRTLDRGNIVHAGDTGGIVTINQIHPIYVGFALPADTLPELRSRFEAQSVEVTAATSAGRPLATGRLAVIDNQISSATGTILYKAEFDNRDDALWPGQFVNIRVLAGVRRDAVTVPPTAILHGPHGTYAFVVGSDRSVTKRPVTVGYENESLAVIDAGLTPGEEVVTDGQYRIEAGSLVDILPPDKAPARSGAGADR